MQNLHTDELIVQLLILFKLILFCENEIRLAKPNHMEFFPVNL